MTTLTNNKRFVSAGFIISAEYILIATLLSLSFLVIIGSRIQAQVCYQLAKLDAAVVALNEYPEPDPDPVAYSVDFASPDGFGGFTPDSTTTSVLLGPDEVWIERDSLLLASEDGVIGRVNGDIQGGSTALLTSPEFNVLGETNVSFEHRMIDLLGHAEAGINYQVNGGGYSAVPTDWFTSGDYNNGDFWTGSGVYDGGLLGLPASSFTTMGLTSGDTVQFQFELGFDPGFLLSPSIEWSLYNFNIDNLSSLPGGP